MTHKLENKIILVLVRLFRIYYRFLEAVRAKSIARLVRNAAWRSRLKKLGEGSNFYGTAVIHHPERVAIGERCSIGEFVHIWGGGGIEIGDDVLIASHAALTSQTHDRCAKIYRETSVEKPIIVEDNVWIGTGAVVLPGVTVGAGAIIGAGAIVTRDVAPRSVVVGIPARERSLPGAVGDESYK
jgi:maltose O-acetyltransferase